MSKGVLMVLAVFAVSVLAASASSEKVVISGYVLQAKTGAPFPSDGDGDVTLHLRRVFPRFWEQKPPRLMPMDGGGFKAEPLLIPQPSEFVSTSWCGGEKKYHHGCVLEDGSFVFTRDTLSALVSEEAKEMPLEVDNYSITVLVNGVPTTGVQIPERELRLTPNYCVL